jgi:hypothetical protein
MQYQRGETHTLGLVDEAGEYLARHWVHAPKLSRRQVRRARARSATWNITAAALVVASLGIYICGLIFLIRLI